MNIRTVTRGDAALAAAALLLLISSFLPYYSGPCGFGGATCTANAWHSSFFPLLPAVFLLGIVAGALVLLGRLLPQAPRPAGIGLTEWGVVLTVATLWSALWSLFGTPGPSHSIGAYLAFVFALVLVVAAVATPLVPALSAPLLPPSTQAVGAGGYPVYGQPDQSGQAPYQQAPHQQSPGQQFEHGQPVQQAQPGQPFTGPQQGDGGYGYPQQAQGQAAQSQQPGYPQPAQPFGGQQPTPVPQPAPVPEAATPQAATPQAVTPQDAPPRAREDSATALLTPVVRPQSEAEQPRTDAPAAASAEPQSLRKSQPATPSEAQPTPQSASPSTSHPMSRATPAPADTGPQSAAPAFAPFWFAVPAIRTLAPEHAGDSGPVGELVPGTWYLAIAQHGDALLTQTQEGRRGLLGDTSGIQRG